MTKRVFIVHGWDGYPEEGWFPWLKKELEAKGFEVFVPQLPDAGSPRIFKWVPKLAEVVGQPDQQTYFVGHSMGCQTIARYLESLPKSIKVGGVVFVAGFFKHLTGLEDDADVRQTDEHWLGTPLDLTKAKEHLPHSVAIFSDDDPWVPLDNQDDFKNKLGSEIIVEHKQGHFSGPRDSTTKLPIVLEKILAITKYNMWKKIIVFIFLIVIAVIAYGIYQAKTEQLSVIAVRDQKNGTYLVGDKKITLKDGYAEEVIEPDSASKLITRYFGNEVRADFNNDGTADLVFLLTQQSGGSGTFYYVVAALGSENGYRGTNAILLGDRIAPQSTEFRNGEVIVNYADRRPDESMTASPSIGVSKYFQVDNDQLKTIKK